MPARFVLEVETDSPARAATLRLLVPGGECVGEHRIQLDAHPVARWEGLFHPRRYVRRVARDSRQAEVLLDAVGAFLGRTVLGSQLTHALAAGSEARTLLVRIVGETDDPLAAAFAQVPWDLARLEGDLRTLRQRGVTVRVRLARRDERAAKSTDGASIPPPEGSDAAPRPSAATLPGAGEPIRVLLVFAEPRGARPAGARIEREELLDTFFREIVPRRGVEVDVLSHGVTRAQLWEQVRSRGGYHVVHWSGRAVEGGLEIELEPGEEEDACISGEELADLLSGSGGGEVAPALVLLSASRAGALGTARDWDSVRTAMSEPAPAAAEPTLEQVFEVRSGTSAVGLAMSAAGVPAVVAMRHEVAPSYARRFGRGFFRRLLGSEGRTSVEEALAATQRELAGAHGVEKGEKPPRGAVTPKERGVLLAGSSASVVRATGGDVIGGELRSARLTPRTPEQPMRVEAAPLATDSGRTPVMSSSIEVPSSARTRAVGEPWQADLLDQSALILLGGASIEVAPEEGRSAPAARVEPRPMPLLESGSKELEPSPGFVGRGMELGRLAREWLAPGGKTIALVEGPGGMGKTSLAAEAIHLWHGHFDLVLAFQPFRESSSTTLRVEGDDRGGAASVFGGLPPEIETLLRYVDRRLREESPRYRDRCERDPFLRVYTPPGEEEQAGARAARLLENLAESLVTDRVLLVLDGVERGAGTEGQEADAPWWQLLAQLRPRLGEGRARILVTCRRSPPATVLPAVFRLALGGLPLGHAAVLADRRSALREILARGTRERREGGTAGQAERLARRVLEVTHGHPLVLLRFGDVAGMGRTVLEGALDRLGALGDGLPPDALPGGLGEAERQRALLEDVGAGLFDLLLERLSPSARRLLWGMSLASEPVPAWMIEDLGAKLLPGEERPRTALAELCAAGLVVREEEQARGTVYAFHSLVAERTAAWMTQHLDEQGDASTEDLYRCFGERYTAAFRNALPMLQQGLLTIPPVAEEPRAWTGPVSSSEPRSKPPSAPSSESRPRAARRPRELCAELGRRSVRYLVRGRAFQALSAFGSAALTGAGDAVLLSEVMDDLEAAADHGAGATRWRARVSLADALRSARQVEMALPLYERAASDAAASEHWADLGVILTKWAAALAQEGQLDAARELFERGAEAKRRAGKPLAQVIGVELEALRIDVLRRGAAAALPAIEERVATLRGLWTGRPDTEESALNSESTQIGSALATGLDVARRANAELERWDVCLSLLDELEALDRDLGAAELEMSRERFHRWTPLARLGRTAEATEVIEGCLEGFRRARDTRGEVRALSALATVHAEVGDFEAATGLEREALSARERFASASERAVAHCRLASLLVRAGSAVEAMENALAAVAYQLAAGQEARAEFRLLAMSARDAANLAVREDTGDVASSSDVVLQSGARPVLLSSVPRLTSLLERPPFASVRKFLAERGVSIDMLQGRIDELLGHAADDLEHGPMPTFSMEEAG
ncbi:AAA family ATPase [Chondromyces crocatus]|uniref:CHAT domain-containing protein n=1 Tax=Chondromyces crocatus TaxID=52 RepID=A0A0K1EFP8_CHOCO|nr:AAA family ATPase [Chondromyces crocatus]AKT39690.1 uncharacterized protein CMC5_038390 [Chondromyces crocatus]